MMPCSEPVYATNVLISHFECDYCRNNIIGYKNNWHITYKVNCTPGDVAFLTFEFLDTRGRDCDERYDITLFKLNI